MSRRRQRVKPQRRPHRPTEVSDEYRRPGVRGHALTAWHAAPLLIERRGVAVLTGYTRRPDSVLAGHLFCERPPYWVIEVLG